MIRMICYDVAKNKPRTELANQLIYLGFERVQYSVFVGRISPARWKTAWKEMQKFFLEKCEKTDRIYSHVIERDHFRGMGILGAGMDLDWILQEVDVWFP